MFPRRALGSAAGFPPAHNLAHGKRGRRAAVLLGSAGRVSATARLAWAAAAVGASQPELGVA